MIKPQVIYAFAIASLALLALFAIVSATKIEIKFKDVDRTQELLENQEDLRAKFKHFQAIMKSEVGKMKEKLEFLEARVKEQDSMLRNCNVCSGQVKKFETGMAFDSNVASAKSIRKTTTLYPKTCLEAHTDDPSLESGMFWIDPDGQNRGDDPIYVYCNMTIGSSVVLHDSESSIDVDHCFDPGCYSHQIKYNASLRQMTMLSALSNECHQTIQVDCFDAAFEFNGIAYAWWNDRNGDPRYFWSGINDNSSDHYHTCQCGLDGSCKDKYLSCNCDSDLAIKLSDIGLITDRDLLPVTQLNFGRTVAETSTSSFTLGRLECSGKAVLNGMPTSCQDLWRIGYILTGLYSIKGPSSNRVETVYCDFSKLPGDQGLETWIGYADVTSTPVYFSVKRNSSYKPTIYEKTIPFEQELLNVGEAINLSSGIFTAPRPGIYYFSFSCTTDNGNSIHVDLQLNDAPIVGCSTSSYAGLQCHISTTLELGSGDRVQMFLQKETTSDARFTGWLIEEYIF